MVPGAKEGRRSGVFAVNTKPIRGSFATYRKVVRGNIHVATVDLEKLSKILLNWGDLPRTISDVKAGELAALAEHWLWLWKRHKRTKRVRGRSRREQNKGKLP